MPRITSLDALKGFAIFAVICLHVPAPNASLGWQVFCQACRFAVPCFFICAGYLFHRSWHQTSDPKQLLQKYAFRLIKLFLFWSLFYAIIPPFIGGAPNGILAAILEHLVNIVRYPHSFIFYSSAYHLWFLSSLLQAAVIVWTCLRFGNLQLALMLGLLLYGVALAGGAYSETPAGFNAGFDMKNGPFVSTLFFTLGAWINARQQATLTGGLLLIVAGLSVQLAEAFVLHHKFGHPITNYSYLIGTVPYSLGCMLIAVSRPAFETAANQFGTASLGIYVLHPYLIVLLSLLPFCSIIFSIPIVAALVVLLTSFGVTKMLSKIPRCKSVVG